MDIRTQTKVTGHVNLKLFSSNGQLKERRDFNNLVVTVGKNFLAAWLTTAEAGGFMPFVALGTGSNAPSAGDTTLQTELVGGGYSRVSGTLTSALNVLQNVTSFGPGNGTGALTECGLFSASTIGTMFARQVFSVVNKASGDTLQVTWQILFS